MKTKMSGLQLGSCSMGDLDIAHGQYDKLTSMGTLRAEDVTFGQLKVLGSAHVEHCAITDVQVAGHMDAVDGSILYGEVAGELHLRGHMEFGTLKILGVVESEDSTCRILQYGSEDLRSRRKKRPIIAGNFAGETLENFFPLKLGKKQRFKNILNGAQIDSDDTITCERFFSFGKVRAQEIDADMCYLYPNKYVDIQEIHGSVVIVGEDFDTSWLKDVAMDIHASDLRTRETCAKAYVHVIEADEVIVNHMKCNTIRGQRIVVGADSVVNRIEYSESCEVDERAVVKEIVKL